MLSLPLARPTYPPREFITLRRLPAASLQEGLDAFTESGLQVDARLYAMAVGYTLGRNAAPGGRSRCRRRWAGRALVASLAGVAAAAAAAMLATGGGRRCRA